MDAATHVVRVPSQRRHAFAGRHVPDLERLVVRPRHDAPPVRKHGNAIDLRRSQIITKVQWTPQRRPFQRRHAFAGRHSHTLSVLSFDPDTTRRPSGNTATPRTYDEAHHHKSTANAPPVSVATHLPVATSQTLACCRATQTRRAARPANTATLKTYDEARSSQKYSGRRNARSSVADLPCPFSVATHSPVATSQTLSVMSWTRRTQHDAPPVRRYGNTIGPTNTKPDHHKSTVDAATHVNSSALPASPRIRRSPRPRP